ncbi:MAG: hypothetical protein NVS3B14_16360 [Ktedonobacteraceae bacterium]
MLGIADPHAISKFINAIAELNGSTVLHLINQLSEDGADLRQVNMQVMEYWRALMLTRAGADTAAILDLTEDEAREVREMAQRFLLEELTECARIFAQNDLALKNQGTPQLGLELAALEAIETHRRAQPGRPAQPAPVSRNTPSREAVAHNAAPEKAQRSHEEIRSVPTHQEVAPAAQLNGQMPLTVQRVIDAWENVRKRTKQKSKSAVLAANLNRYKIVGIEGSPEHPVVVIQAEKSAHYKFVKDENRYKDLEWALGMEFSLPCQVRLVPPDQSPSLAPVPDAASYSTGAALAPQPSAYREPQLTAKPPSTAEDDEQPVSQESLEPQHDASSLDLYADLPGTTGAAILARTNMVRENKQVVSKESLEQKVRRDPVVQEVMRTFSARIADIQPK